jgi:uncharacterized protein (DUF58 family)
LNAPSVTAHLDGDINLRVGAPAILLRYIVNMKTLDSRPLQTIFSKSFFVEKKESITIQKRGVYFSDYAYRIICDIFGFFNFRIKIKTESAERLVVYPIENAAYKAMETWGSGQNEKSAFASNDNLIEQRKYMPGDDPRRINWKLFGHSEELFVREGEKTGEAKSDLIIVCDTALCDTASADRLCEKALSYAIRASGYAAKIVLYYRNESEGKDTALDNWNKLIWMPEGNAQNSANKLRAMFAYPFAISGKPVDALPDSLRGGESDNIVIFRNEE